MQRLGRGLEEDADGSSFHTLQGNQHIPPSCWEVARKSIENQKCPAIVRDVPSSKDILFISLPVSGVFVASGFCVVALLFYSFWGVVCLQDGIL